MKEIKIYVNEKCILIYFINDYKNNSNNFLDEINYYYIMKEFE